GRRVGSQSQRFLRWLAIVNRVPDFVGDERHDRMQQAQRCLEQCDEVGARTLLADTVVEPRLDQFDIPVAELTPEEIVNRVRCLIETICRQRFVYCTCNAVEARKNPAVLEGLGLKSRNASLLC